MRKTAIFGNVTSISMSEEIKYIYISIGRYIHEENAYRLTNKFDKY